MALKILVFLMLDHLFIIFYIAPAVLNNIITKNMFPTKHPNRTMSQNNHILRLKNVITLTYDILYYKQQFHKKYSKFRKYIYSSTFYLINTNRYGREENFMTDIINSRQRLSTNPYFYQSFRI